MSSPAPQTTPQPTLFQQQQSRQAAAPPPPPQHAIDPFAALASTARSTTPQKSIFDFGNHQPPPVAPAAVSAPAAADDDEWAFSSALPEGPPSNNITVNDTSLDISLHVTRESAIPSVITMSLSFSNKTEQPISELEFKAAVTKVCLFLHHHVHSLIRAGLFSQATTTNRKKTPAS